LVWLVPWIVTFGVALFFGVNDDALVTLVELLALSVNFVGGWTSTSSMLFLKVTPASVFIDG